MCIVIQHEIVRHNTKRLPRHQGMTKFGFYFQRAKVHQLAFYLMPSPSPI